MENENESPDECEVDGVTYMEYEFHALHTFFPGLDESEFNALRRFSGKNLTRGCTADFWRDDKSVDYWHYWIGDIQTQTMSKSIKPMASRGICLVLDACGGRENWVLTQNNSTQYEKKEAQKNLQSRPHKTGEIVYFLQAGDFIKIGKTTGSAENRLLQLKTGCPFPVEIVAVIAGGYDKERSLHHRFRNIRAHGEWFHATKEILSFITSLNGVA